MAPRGRFAAAGRPRTTGACAAGSCAAGMGRSCGRSYAEPSDAAAGDAGRGAAARIVRGLLRVAPADRDDAAAAAAKLEVLLFVLPLLPRGGACRRGSREPVRCVTACCRRRGRGRGCRRVRARGPVADGGRRGGGRRGGQRAGRAARGLPRVAPRGARGSGGRAPSARVRLWGGVRALWGAVAPEGSGTGWWRCSGRQRCVGARRK